MGFLCLSGFTECFLVNLSNNTSCSSLFWQMWCHTDDSVSCTLHVLIRKDKFKNLQVYGNKKTIITFPIFISTFNNQATHYTLSSCKNLYPQITLFTIIFIAMCIQFICKTKVIAHYLQNLVYKFFLQKETYLQIYHTRMEAYLWYL